MHKSSAEAFLDEEFNLYVNSTIQQKATLHLYSGRNKVGEQ